MKTSVIITVSIIVLLLLVIRGVYKHSDGVSDERSWYIDRLNFEFSGEIDSIARLRKNHGLIHFHFTGGTIDRSTEDMLNRHLKYNGNLRLILYGKKSARVTLFTKHIDDYLPGDSLWVNTSSNKIKVFRNGTLVSENSATESLNGRPF